jgi:competence protein ComEC
MKRILSVLLSVLLLIACSVQASAPKARSSNQAFKQQTNEIIVYVTNTGSKYHRGSCRYLRQSKIPMALKDAKVDYEPCSVCKPPR